MLTLYTVLCDMCDPHDSGHESTVSCFRMRRNPSGKQSTVRDIYFRKRNVFQERVYVDEHIMAMAWLHGH